LNSIGIIPVLVDESNTEIIEKLEILKKSEKKAKIDAIESMMLDQRLLSPNDVSSLERYESNLLQTQKQEIKTFRRPKNPFRHTHTYVNRGTEK
jgi:hypothetical protein